MQAIRKHIVFRILTIVLVTGLIAPSVVKFSHIFTHHEHKVCNGEKSTHIHEVDFDCDFLKFKLNNNYYSSFKYKVLFCETISYKIPPLTYKFLNNHQPLSFSLRGPPILV